MTTHRAHETLKKYSCTIKIANAPSQSDFDWNKHLEEMQIKTNRFKVKFDVPSPTLPIWADWVYGYQSLHWLAPSQQCNEIGMYPSKQVTRYEKTEQQSVRHDQTVHNECDR
jgi:hypothetical protein